MNADLAQHVLDELWLLGVREIVVCPGGRNAPIVELLATGRTHFEVHWHFEERSAAFFALGRAAQRKHLVAVSTTSGTAAGELLPATMEAAYSGVPLVLVTADRPRRFRGSGAPQAAEQVGLFGTYASPTLDLAGDERADLKALTVVKPLHLNICFEEPGNESTPCEQPAVTTRNVVHNDPAGAAAFLTTVGCPLVIVGALQLSDRPRVREFLDSLGAPIIAEAHSGLREDAALEGLRFNVADRLIDRLGAHGYQVDGIIRIGGVPTHRLWRDLEERYVHLPVLSISRVPLTGLGRSSQLLVDEVPDVATRPVVWPVAAHMQDRELAAGIRLLLRQEPNAEPAWVERLSQAFPPESHVYLGNSMPIRQWDLAATHEQRKLQVSTSRGLNGIDGQVSTFLGRCVSGVPNWAILGDLTALYDLAGPWIARDLEGEVAATLVALNNKGGRIFDRMFQAPAFQNSHSVDFEKWAGMWSVPYSRMCLGDEVPTTSIGLSVLEITPDHGATRRWWKAYEALIR